LRGTGQHSRRTRLRAAATGTIAAILTAALAACGGGNSSDAEDPTGKFPIEVVTSEFPPRQLLAQTTLMRIGIRNTGDRTVPDLAVTVSLAGEEGKNSSLPFATKTPQPGVELPFRPVWVLAYGYPKVDPSLRLGGTETADPRTFDLGALQPGETANAVWKLSAVKAGDYTLRYRVNASLEEAEAKAVGPGGDPVTGSFPVTIDAVPPDTRVNGQGEVVVIDPR
jgi:hypothetical protein